MQNKVFALITMHLLFVMIALFENFKTKRKRPPVETPEFIDLLAVFVINLLAGGAFCCVDKHCSESAHMHAEYACISVCICGYLHQLSAFEVSCFYK